MTYPTPDPAPTVGAPVTMDSYGGSEPGEIIRVSTSGRCFWFQLATVSRSPDGSIRVERNPDAWVHRAIRQADEVFREDLDMWRVRPGVAVFRPRTSPGPAAPGKRRVSQIADAVERVEPWLRKTRWYPMTYMAIPSVLRKADELLDELAAFGPAEPSEMAEAAALRERLAVLRAGFGRKR